MWWVYAFQRITQTRNTKLTAPTLRQRVWCYPLGGFLCAGFLGLSCCARGSLIAVQRFLTGAAPLLRSRRFSGRSAQTPERPQWSGPPAQPFPGLWNPPRPGMEPVSSPLAGQLPSTVPPGKPETKSEPGLCLPRSHQKAFFRSILRLWFLI